MYQSDGLRPTIEAYQATQQKSLSFCIAICKRHSHSTLPSQCTDPRRLLGEIPAFPSAKQHREQRLEYICQPRSLLVGGQSEWKTSISDCELPNIILRHELLIGVYEPMPLKLHDNDRLRHWPGSESDCGGPRCRGNYIAVLVMAWAYVLSARWAELLTSDSTDSDPLPATFDITYAPSTGSDVDGGSIPKITIDVGPVSDMAALWWTKILAIGRGWEASGTVNGQKYRSPWSYHIESETIFEVNREGTEIKGESLQAVPPSSDAALKYIADFCAFYDIRSECDAALSAVLLFPSRLARLAHVQLPLPYPHPKDGSLKTRPTPSDNNNISQHQSLIANYITFSCNIKGMRPLLMGTLCNPNVECNLVTAWLEPIFTVIDAVIAQEHYRTLVTILAQAEPRVASLWLGAIILGWERQIFSAVRGGNAGIDLLAAAWTNTVHSFISIPTKRGGQLPSSDEVSLRRADECRLLFLTQSESHLRPPVHVYPPPGFTRVSSLDLDIRQHVDCEGHNMEYKNWCWITEDGTLLRTECSENSANQCYERMVEAGPSELLVPDDLLDLHRIQTQSDIASAQASQIFWWLRPAGSSAEEQDIFMDPWLLPDSEDSQSEGFESSSDIFREESESMD